MARGDQLARQWKIFHTLITSRYGKSVNDLAGDLECHPRTVYRDLDALQAAGFPIYNERVNGTNRWAVLESAKQQVPIPFNLTELMALYFGRDALNVLKDTMFHDSLASLFQKIKTTLTPESKKYLGRIQKSLKVGPQPYKPYRKFKLVIEQINDAVMDCRVVDIVYYSMSRDKVTRRNVSPYKIWYSNGTFYLVGYCHRKKDIRVFAVDRIQMLTVTDDTFEVPDSFDIEDFMQNSFGVFHGKPVKVRIHFTADAAGYVKEKIWHASQKIEEFDDGSIIFEAEVAGTDEIKLWVMRWGSKAYVLEPRHLKEEIQSEAAGMLVMYENGIARQEKALTA
jgi:predicted DNA-binding transcriptional regulator YafY